MRDADMLENHIIQARVQATATESQARVRVVEEVGEAYHQLGLPPGNCFKIAAATVLFLSMAR